MSPTTEKIYDLTVIGGGAGGLVSAGFAAALGANVALISRSPLGGECLYTGCVPSKTMAYMARLCHQAETYGLASPTGEGACRFEQVMEQVQKTIQAIEPHDSPEHLKKEYGVSEIIRGKAEFSDSSMVMVGNQTIRSRKFIVATGSKAVIPPIKGLEGVPYWTHETVFQQRKRPNHLVILGGGPIGIEFSQIFRRLGSEVTVIQKAERILTKEEPETSGFVLDFLKREGISFHLSASLEEVTHDGNRFHLRVQTGDHNFIPLDCDALLIAVGKSPRTQGLGLEAAGVRYDKHGITVNDHCQTTCPNIWAVGDVSGQYQFTHYAEHQAKVAVTHALLKWPEKMEREVVPWVTFIDPEVAHVGILYEQAQKKHGKVFRFRIELSAIDRPVIEEETHGYADVITDKKGRILGATVIGPHAGELIHEAALAMKGGQTVKHLGQLIHAYPTRSDIWKQFSLPFYRETLLHGKLKRLIQWWISY